MNGWVVYGIGLLAQLLFSARLIIQWVASEKQKKSRTPGSFWMHSLIASFLMFFYGYFRNDFAIMLGQTLTYFIYIRNLHLRGDWEGLPGLIRYFILSFPFLIIIYYFNNERPDLYNLFHQDNISSGLLLLGVTGQIIFTFRFIIQWLHAEKIRQSVIPLSFWYYSLVGSMLIIVYSVFRKDPVLFIGQLCGAVIYYRNIVLGKR
jgi:lipid-A-disaccharide synthase-like uncharacterized protein